MPGAWRAAGGEYPSLRCNFRGRGRDGIEKWGTMDRIVSCGSEV